MKNNNKGKKPIQIKQKLRKKVQIKQLKKYSKLSDEKEEQKLPIVQINQKQQNIIKNNIVNCRSRKSSLIFNNIPIASYSQYCSSITLKLIINMLNNDLLSDQDKLIKLDKYLNLSRFIINQSIKNNFIRNFSHLLDQNFQKKLQQYLIKIRNKKVADQLIEKIENGYHQNHTKQLKNKYYSIMNENDSDYQYNQDDIRYDDISLFQMKFTKKNINKETIQPIKNKKIMTIIDQKDIHQIVQYKIKPNLSRIVTLDNNQNAIHHKRVFTISPIANQYLPNNLKLRIRGKN